MLSMYTRGILMIQISLLINAYDLGQINQRQKRALNTFSEYLESIKSLHVKKDRIFSDMVTSGLDDSQNSIRIKAWINKRSYSLDNNVGCSPQALLWMDDEFYSNNMSPIQLGKIIRLSDLSYF